ncbi:hypothetical protein [Paenibacillus sp. S150]|uniref:phage tail protein n=1 Tax=Paenibacillus sp. S150 TaxID=2749826 RepID=UPI001C590C54|nr:hypothetical protein [Paenibacillus sp. S150]MBW4083532.1 hypothetical protein [Paenibacillus sp. S150]
MAVVKNLLIRAGADFSALRNATRQAQRDLNGFKSSVAKTVKGIGTLLAGIGAGFAIGGAVKDAMQFEAAIMQINRTLGSNAGAFQKWAKENEKTLGMSTLEITKYAAVYSNLISGFSATTRETTQRTQALLQASATVAAATGRTMEDTMERIRSGLLGNTESIEDLGINVNVALLESSKSFQQFANGRSWNQIDFQTQQTIRLMAILEQATNKYGTTVADNTAYRQAVFVAQLKNTRLALGQAFLPIYNFILPALTRLASALATAINFVAQFTTALFGGSSQVKATAAQANAVSGLGSAYGDAADQAKAAGDEAKKAGKKAQKSVAGFDQLNLVGDKSSAADSGADAGAAGIGDMNVDTGAGVGALGTMGASMIDVSDKAKAMAEKVKKAFAAMKKAVTDNKDIIIAALAGLATAFAGFWLATKWGSMVKAIQTAGKVIGAVIAGISWPIVLLIATVAALVGAFVYFYRTNEQFRNTVQDIFQKIKDIAVDLWQNVMVPFGQWLMGELPKAWDAVAQAAKVLWDNVLVPFGKWLADVLPKAWKVVADVAMWLWDNVLKPFGAWLMDVMPKAWGAVQKAALFLWNDVLKPFGNFLLWIWKEVIVPLAKILGDVLAIAFKFVADVATSLWKNVIVPLAKALSELFGPAVEAVSAVLTFLWQKVFTPFVSFLAGTVKVVFESLITVITFLWKNVLKPVAEYMGGAFAQLFDTVFRSVGTLIDGLKTSLKGLLTFVTGVFTGDWGKAWEGVKSVFKGVFDSLYGLVKLPLNLIIDAINRVIDGINKVSFDMPDFLGGGTFGMSIKNISHLAKGGLAYGPTLAVVGDNKGAASNPEVIAPLSKLEGMMNNGGDNREVVSVLRELIQTVKTSGGNVTLQVGATELARAVASGANEIQRRTGKSIFVI